MMNVTIRHIEFLVSTHNCVVIPGLGAILAHRQCAQISADGLSIIPPRRVYTFNGSLIQTDGLVEHSVARSLDISFERASAIVAADIDTMRHQLAADRSLSLGRIGTLTHDDNDNVIFNPFDTDALTPGANWMSSLNLCKANVAKDAADTDENDTPKGRVLTPVTRFVRAAAAAVVIAVIAFASSTPITINDANYASIALPEIKKPKAQFVPSNTTPVLEIIDNNSNTPVDTAARSAYQRAQKLASVKPVVAPKPQVQEPAPIVPAQKTEPATSKRFNDADAYCVVVASVNNLEQAQKCITEINNKYGEKCSMLEKDGRFRIYVATAQSSNAARQAINAGLAKRYPGAWVCAR
jgi:hypothetical protein